MSDPAVSDPRRIGVFHRLSAALRQRSFLREFRIPPPAWPRGLAETYASFHSVRTDIESQRAELEEERRRLEHALATLEEARRRDPGGPEGPPGGGGVDDEALADSAIGVWRTQRKLDGTGDEGGALVRQLRRHLTVAWDGLAKLEVRTQDHDGDAYDAGMALDVLATEPRAGFTREMIIETVQPTVYRSDRPVRMGQVIVGRPERPSDS